MPFLFTINSNVIQSVTAMTSVAKVLPGYFKVIRIFLLTSDRIINRFETLKSMQFVYLPERRGYASSLPFLEPCSEYSLSKKTQLNISSGDPEYELLSHLHTPAYGCSTPKINKYRQTSIGSSGLLYSNFNSVQIQLRFPSAHLIPFRFIDFRS